MKHLDKAVILLLNLCLLFSAIMIPALCFAKSPAYYRRSFAKMGIYERVDESGQPYRTVISYINGDKESYALLSDSQLDTVALHIIGYMRGDIEDFELYMNDVYLNDAYADGVRIFGDAAISHMQDVRVLVNRAEIAAAVLFCLLPPLLLYLIARRRTAGRFIVRYTLLFYAALIAFSLLFLLVTAFTSIGELDYTRALWRNLHYLFFPFRGDKVEASFFNDALTVILRVDLFMGAVYSILAIVAGVFLLFFLLGRWLQKYGKQ